MGEITKHFSTSTFVVFKGKVLLHIHKKFGFLLPVGGHIDRDELPELAAKREVKEESGLDVEIVNFKKLDEWGDESEINVGEFCNLHYINEFHQHIDFVFFAKAVSGDLKPQKGESKDLIWFSYDEIMNHSNLKESTKKYALFALDNVK